MDDLDVKKAVRERYAATALTGASCCGAAPAAAEAPIAAAAGAGASCCGPAGARNLADAVSAEIGYTTGDMTEVPEGANLGLGCGNPVALASLRPGETVLDLGSGGGFDCFLAATRVGPEGRVIGVDMTPEMIALARANSAKAPHANVEFRLGEIENLPVGDASVDVVMSNCVINLAPDKRRVFDEAFRALKPGGRVMISDIVLTGELPDAVRRSTAAYVSCLGGAVLIDDYLATVRAAGFDDVEVVASTDYGDESLLGGYADEAAAQLEMSVDEIRRFARLFRSITVSARKPTAA